MLALQRYKFCVVYKPGKNHQDADALSRCPQPLTAKSGDQFKLSDVVPLAPLNLTLLPSEQRQDPWIMSIIELLENPPSNSSAYLRRKSQHFEMREGLLYRRDFFPEGHRWLLVIPHYLRKEILSALHDDPRAGHMGFHKTYVRVRQRFFWPRLYRPVNSYVKSCLSCQRRKRPTTGPVGLLQPSPCPGKPFECVGIDLYGPLPLNSFGNRWVFTAVDLSHRVGCKTLSMLSVWKAL